MRVVVGITGASGSVFAVRMLQMLQSAPDIETHVVVSKWGEVNLRHELGMTARDVTELADQRHSDADLASPLASGSFRVASTIIMPCSAKTLSRVATGTGDSLISRAADVALKERRRLVLALRESPLSLVHLNAATAATQAGAIVAPISPAFYTLPETIDELVDGVVYRMLDACEIYLDGRTSWGETHDIERGRDRARQAG